MPNVIIIPDPQVQKVCQDAVNFANNCQSDFTFYLIPPLNDANSPLLYETIDFSVALSYLEKLKKDQNYNNEDFILSFYNGVLTAEEDGYSNLFLAGARYDETYPCTGIISLKYLGWRVLEEKYNYELQKHSILHLIVCGMIGSYTHLNPHKDIGCLLDQNMILSNFNLKLQKGYYLCSKTEFNCYHNITKEKYGNSILRLCDSFKTGISNKPESSISTVPKLPKKKLKLELSHKLALISIGLAIIVILFGNNMCERFIQYKEKINNSKIDKNSSVKIKPNTVLNIQLPYLDNVPIIDKGIFIKYYYNDLIFGGVNINSVSICARTSKGEKLDINRSNYELIMDITKEPYVEFEYKGITYSIEISQHPSSVNCIIKKNINPTLVLKKAETFVDLKEL
jgi:hypothetical protein